MSTNTDDEPVFPKWSPKAAVAIWRDHWKEEHDRRLAHQEIIRDGIARGEIPPDQNIDELAVQWESEYGPSLAMMLWRCLSYEATKEVWTRIQDMDCSRRGVDPIAVTAMTCVRGYMGPIGTERKTRKEREKWIADTKAAAELLASLLDGSRLDGWLFNEYQRVYLGHIVNKSLSLGLQGIAENKEIKRNFDFFHSNLSHRLWRFSNLLRDFASGIEASAKEAVVLAKPGDPDARRAYFVKYLTEGFMFLFNAPMRKEVALLTGAAFECAISEREVRRLAPRVD